MCRCGRCTSTARREGCPALTGATPSSARWRTSCSSDGTPARPSRSRRPSGSRTGRLGAAHPRHDRAAAGVRAARAGVPQPARRSGDGGRGAHERAEAGRCRRRAPPVHPGRLRQGGGGVEQLRDALDGLEHVGFGTSPPGTPGTGEPARSLAVRPRDDARLRRSLLVSTVRRARSWLKPWPHRMSSRCSVGRPRREAELSARHVSARGAAPSADALDVAPVVESRTLHAVDEDPSAVEHRGVQRNAAEPLQVVGDPVAAELEAALAMRRAGADPKALRRALRRIEELLDDE